MTWLLWLRSVPRWAWIALGIAAVIVAILLYLDHTRDKAVRQDRAEREAEVSSVTLQAEREANRRDEQRRVERVQQMHELETAREEAVEREPEATRQPAGPAVREVLESIRAQAGAIAANSSSIGAIETNQPVSNPYPRTSLNCWALANWRPLMTAQPKAAAAKK